MTKAEKVDCGIADADAGRVVAHRVGKRKAQAKKELMEMCEILVCAKSPKLIAQIKKRLAAILYGS